MDAFLFNHDHYYEHYNCTFYSVDDIPIEKRRHVMGGSIIMGFYFIFFFLYALCFYAMIVTPFLNKATRFLMILLACIHIIGLQLGGFLTAYLAIEGAVFCSRPYVIYIGGAFGVATWSGSTLTNILLFLNRCSELYSSHFANTLFGGKRIYFWLSLPIIYMSYVLFFTPPNLYSGILMSWFFNPHFGYYPDSDVYINHVLVFNDLLCCSIDLLMYVALILLYWRAVRNFPPEQRAQLRREKRIYIQVFMVGFIHFTVSITYMIMQFFPVSLVTTQTEAAFYLLSQGFPPVIYLYANKSLRQTLLTKLRLANNKFWVGVMLSAQRMTTQVGSASVGGFGSIHSSQHQSQHASNTRGSIAK